MKLRTLVLATALALSVTPALAPVSAASTGDRVSAAAQAVPYYTCRKGLRSIGTTNFAYAISLVNQGYYCSPIPIWRG